MIGSSYGIVIYEPKDDIPFNPNVSIEAGFMMALDRPVLLLANEMLPALRVDSWDEVTEENLLAELPDLRKRFSWKSMRKLDMKVWRSLINATADNVRSP